MKKLICVSRELRLASMCLGMERRGSKGVEG